MRLWLLLVSYMQQLNFKNCLTTNNVKGTMSSASNRHYCFANHSVSSYQVCEWFGMLLLRFLSIFTWPFMHMTCYMLYTKWPPRQDTIGSFVEKLVVTLCRICSDQDPHGVPKRLFEDWRLVYGRYKDMRTVGGEAWLIDKMFKRTYSAFWKDRSSLHLQQMGSQVANASKLLPRITEGNEGLKPEIIVASWPLTEAILTYLENGGTFCVAWRPRLRVRKSNHPCLLQ